MSFCNFNFLKNLFTFQRQANNSKENNQSENSSREINSKSMQNLLKSLEGEDYNLYSSDSKKKE